MVRRMAAMAWPFAVRYAAANGCQTSAGVRGSAAVCHGQANCGAAACSHICCQGAKGLPLEADGRPIGQEKGLAVALDGACGAIAMGHGGIHVPTPKGEGQGKAAGVRAGADWGGIHHGEAVVDGRPALSRPVQTSVEARIT